MSQLNRGRPFETLMLHRRTWVVCGLLLLVAACGGSKEPPATTDGSTPSAGAAAPGQPAPDESKKLARFVYIEEGSDLIFTVGVRAAALHEEDPYFPLEFSLTNKMKGVTWVLTRESFRLRDEAGNYYEVPSQKTLAAGYGKRTLDTRLFEARSVTASRHEAYRQVESNFFPDPVAGIIPESDTVTGGAGVAPTSTSLVPIERVELAAKTFMEDVLYFPHPEGLLLGQRLTLEVRTQGMEEPALLVFRIPHIR